MQHKSTAQQWFKPVVQASTDGVIAVAALALAFSLRYEDGLPDRYASGFAGLLLGVSAGKTLISYFLGNYRRMWRYTSQREVLMLAANSGASGPCAGGASATRPRSSPSAFLRRHCHRCRALPHRHGRRAHAPP